MRRRRRRGGSGRMADGATVAAPSTTATAVAPARLAQEQARRQCGLRRRGLQRRASSAEIGEHDEEDALRGLRNWVAVEAGMASVGACGRSMPSGAGGTGGMRGQSRIVDARCSVSERFEGGTGGMRGMVGTASTRTVEVQMMANMRSHVILEVGVQAVGIT